MCKTTQKIESVSCISVESDDCRGCLCLGFQSIGTVTGACITNVKVNGIELRFSIYTSADVTVIPERVYKQVSVTLNCKLLPDIHYVVRRTCIRCAWEVCCQPTSQSVDHTARNICGEMNDRCLLDQP